MNEPSRAGRVAAGGAGGARFACAVLALLGAGACGKIVGLDEYAVGSADGSAGAPRIAFKVAECGACVAAQCAPELDVCESEKDCLEQASCLFGCDRNEGECRYTCFSSVGHYSRSAKNLVACQLDRCLPPLCGTCGSILAGQSASCSRCAEEETEPGGLCEFSTSCLEDDECRAYLKCLTEECEQPGEADPSCRMVCASKRPDAARSFYKTVGNRYFFGCRAACNAGKHWACEQPPPWPPTSGEKASITIRLPSTIAGVDVPVAGVDVRACKVFDDFSCAKPFDEKPTDATGATPPLVVDQLAVPIVYFEVSGPEPYLFAPWQGVVGDLVLWAPGNWVPSRQSLEDLVKARGEPLDLTSLGGVVAVVADCVGGFADALSTSPEITIKPSSGSKPYYSGNPQLEAGGQAWIVNIPPGSVSLEVRRGTVVIANAVVPVRPGKFTVVTFNYPEFL